MRQCIEICAIVVTHHTQADAYGSTEGRLDETMMDRCVGEMLEQHSQKQVWDKGTLDQS